MRFKVVFLISLIIVSYAKAYPPSSGIAVPISPLLPMERRSTGVILSVVSVVGLSRNQLQSRFGGAADHSIPKNLDRISFQEDYEASSVSNYADRSRKNQISNVHFANSDPAKPYLTDPVKIQDNKNSQIYNQGEIPKNSQMNQGANVNLVNRRNQSDESYKNSQMYINSYSNKQQDSQATKDSVDNVRNQHDYYENPQNDEAVNNVSKGQSQPAMVSSSNAVVQNDSGYLFQQNFTPSYSKVTKIERNPFNEAVANSDINEKKGQLYRLPESGTHQFNHEFGGVKEERKKPTGQMPMLLHYPDNNPVLPPNQKIMIDIEYPTENYDVTLYTTRKPLKRPVILRTSSKKP